jgi:hemerythrin-like domain-containing protein
MLLKVGQRADHGFDEPLGLLSDCHRRIEHFLSVLTAIAGQTAGGALDASRRSQLEGALQYFAVAAPRHTDDEEQSLFPRLAASLDTRAAEALDMMRRLERDHAEAGQHHTAVDRLVRDWLRDDALHAEAVRTLRAALAQLQALYARHIAVEDQHLFPAAARILSADDLRHIGREMAARRSTTPR